MYAQETYVLRFVGCLLFGPMTCFIVGELQLSHPIQEELTDFSPFSTGIKKPQARMTSERQQYGDRKYLNKTCPGCVDLTWQELRNAHFTHAAKTLSATDF